MDTIIKKSMSLAGRELSIETGHLAKQASGAVLVRYGDTVVLVTATTSKEPREGVDFFPLTVDYEEKMYAVGKIPGGFLRREGRATEAATLSARLIDRPIRPLFPKGYRCDVQIVATVLSVEADNEPDMCAMIGASACVSYSEIPFAGPIGCLEVGYVDGQIVMNPTQEQKHKSQLDLTVAATEQKVIMIEAGAKELPDEIMYDAIVKAHEDIKQQVGFINDLVAQIGKEKMTYDHADFDQELFDKIVEATMDEARAAMDTDDKNVREERWNKLIDHWHELFLEDYPEMDKYLEEITYKFQKKIVKAWLLEGHRVDGRQKNEIRPLSAEVGVLPRVHGSGLFTRGQTQVLSVCTLDTLSACQKLDTIWEEEEKRYLHHYNFPSYSVGEARAARSVNRREKGHGALAERALEPVIPSQEDFPYAIRVVSEVLESNGSSSMASTCGSCLALMDAGVPISAPVSGVAMGLIKEGDDVVILSDIQGIEDFLGDMDFKVCGTTEGITALQMDNKAKGLSTEILAEALGQAKRGRAFILDAMLEKIPAPREELSEYAPRIITIKIPVDKIRDVIGTGGKVIRGIQEETGASIEVHEDGNVFIASVDTGGEVARKMVEDIVKVPEVGEEYFGRVVGIQPFGAFVELLPGKDGLEKMQSVMKALRGNVPAEFGGVKVVAVRDYLSSERVEGGKTTALTLPKSNVMYFELEGGAWLCVRPSGTEPKIKLYVNAVTKSDADTKSQLNRISNAAVKLLESL